jgi:hypothetical protein
MLFRKTAPMLACLCLVATHATRAQTRSAPFTQSVTASSGVTFSQHLDAASSPIPFSGTGVDARLGYERLAGRWDATLSLDGARRGYASRADAGTSVRERAYDGALTASLLRSFGSDANHGFAAGLAADVRGGLLTHQYADPAATSTDYVQGYALVGPAVAWRHDLFGGTTVARFSVPLVGLAHHPYTDARIDQAPPSFRGVGPRTLRGYDASIGYQTSTRRTIGLTAEFQARTLDYADIQRSRMASTAFIAGVVMRFGRTHP